MARFFLTAAFVGAFLLAPASGSGQEAYTLQRGDSLRFSLLGFTELTTDTTVGIDGMIDVPFVGSINAVGRTAAELKETVAEALNGQIYRFTNREGAQVFYTIRKEDVRLVVDAYRPVTVYGEVALPGEVPFRPGMTVRSALAVVGARGDDMTALKAVELEGSVVSLREQRSHLLAVGWRLQEESDRLSGKAEGPSVMPEGVAAKWSEQQEALLKQTMDSFNSEIAHLQRTIEGVDRGLEILREREQAELEALEGDAEEKRRIDALFSRGIVSLERQSDVRKAQLFSATRLLQTQDAISRASLERIELERELERKVSDRLIRLAELLEENRLKISLLDAEINAAHQQLSTLGAMTAPGQAVSLTIHRSQNDATETVTAGLDDLVLPGDVLEVTYEWLDQ